MSQRFEERMEMEVKRKRKRKKLFIAVSAVLMIYAATMLIPIYFVVINSLKRPLQFYENPWTLPKVLYLANYRFVFQLSVGEVSIFRMYINSIIFTVASTLISCAATTVTAYTAARFDFRGKGLLVSIGIGAMLIPDLGSRSVIYKMYVDLNMIDTWFILIQYATPFGIMFLIAYSLFKTVSKTYAEAAKIDGASETEDICTDHDPHGKRGDRDDDGHVCDRRVERLLYALYVSAFRKDSGARHSGAFRRSADVLQFYGAVCGNGGGNSARSDTVRVHEGYHYKQRRRRRSEGIKPA